MHTRVCLCFSLCVFVLCAFCVPGRRGADYFQITLNRRWKEARHVWGGLVGQNGHLVKVVKKLATWSIVTLWSWWSWWQKGEGVESSDTDHGGQDGEDDEKAAGGQWKYCKICVEDGEEDQVDEDDEK